MKGDEISLEELIEQRRAELGARTDLTPINIESFVKWKKRKLAEKVTISFHVACTICYVIIKIFHNFIDITVYIGYSDTAGKPKKCHCKRLQPYPIIFSVR